MEKDISEELKKCFEIDIYAALIEAIKKQIPYKPKYYKDYPGQCKCGALFLDKKTKYCGNCGQKLSWEDAR